MKYKDAGVNVQRGYDAVERIKEIVSSTHTKNVLSGIGGFGAQFALDPDDPDGTVLVSGADGVGTKLKLAIETDRHDTIGQDCVAMCVNDILCSGARPLFFLDYIATAKIDPVKITQIVSGVAAGCRLSGAALVGGETAEMPGFYESGEYDIAGFAVGSVKRSEIIDGSSINEGDILLGLASSGIHSNGYSLVRKIFKREDYRLQLGNRSLIDILLTPTRIYVKSLLNLGSIIEIKGMSHITGGGLVENVPRMLPDGLAAMIVKNSWPKQPVFDLIKKHADLSDQDMAETFNFGIGFVLAVVPEKKEEAMKFLVDSGELVFEIGQIVKDSKKGIWFE